MRRTIASSLTALATVVLLAGCGESADPVSTGTDPTGPSQTSGTFNDADVAFAQGMIPHHRQAIQMADMATDAAQSAEVRDLAADIEAAQAPEIEAMVGWLESWGEDVPEDMSGMEGMDHGGSATEMPGMMSTEEMAALEAAAGAEFDRLFLTMMIAHHEGAIEQARTEQADGANQHALELADAIIAAQQAEITEMQELLTSS